MNINDRKGIVPKNFKGSTKILGKYTPLGLLMLILSGVFFFIMVVILMNKDFRIVYIPLLVTVPVLTYVITLPNKRYHNFGTKLMMKLNYIKRNKHFNRFVTERNKDNE